MAHKTSGANRPAAMDSTKMHHGRQDAGRTKMSAVAGVHTGPVESKGPKVAARTPMSMKGARSTPKGNFLE